VPDLLAELSAVQETIRVADPRAVATEVTTRNPRLLALFRQERRILRELKLRKALLSRGIGWTVLTADGARKQPADASRAREGQGSRRGAST
jgi:hypothetical protein